MFKKCDLIYAYSEVSLTKLKWDLLVTEENKVQNWRWGSVATFTSQRSYSKHDNALQPSRNRGMWAGWGVTGTAQQA